MFSYLSNKVLCLIVSDYLIRTRINTDHHSIIVSGPCVAQSLTCDN